MLEVCLEVDPSAFTRPVSPCSFEAIACGAFVIVSSLELVVCLTSVIEIQLLGVHLILGVAFFLMPPEANLEKGAAGYVHSRQVLG